jgi:hypothetical protein
MRFRPKKFWFFLFAGFSSRWARTITPQARPQLWGATVPAFGMAFFLKKITSPFSYDTHALDRLGMFIA